MAEIVIVSDPGSVTSLHSQAREVTNWSTKSSPAGCLLADRCVVNSVPLTLASELFIWVICLEFLVFRCPCRCLHTNKQGQRQGLRLSTRSSPTGWQEPGRGRKTRLRCRFCLVAFCCVFERGLCKILNWRTGALSVHENEFELNWNDRKRNLVICNSTKCHLAICLFCLFFCFITPHPLQKKVIFLVRNSYMTFK